MMEIIKKLFFSQAERHLVSDIFTSIPRIICGLLLTLTFGSDKFGLPWSRGGDLSLFEVASWFPKDVAEFGFPFTISPWFFAWIGAASEAIGGLFLALGLGTRFWSFMIGSTMLVAIFFQKWEQFLEQGPWAILPAVGFLWVAIYSFIYGSGKIGLDYHIWKRINKKTATL
jgi:putative oxidoreductase